VQTAGCEVAYRTGGEGPPLVILHHEIGNPGWLPFYTDLGQSHTVIVPDLPGYGDSERPAWARNPRDLAAMMQLFLDQVAPGPVDLVGLGFGGWLAAEMAANNQRRLSHLILVNPYGLKPRQGEIVDQFLISHEGFVREGFADPTAFEAVYAAVPPVDQLEAWDIHREMTTRIAWTPYMFDPALEHLLASITLPVLVVRGAADRIVPADHAARYAAALPNARLMDLPAAGHFAEMERPAELAAAVREFVTR
jgi:pimeloyl-ACP methyl ester carboxylesterase